MIYLFIGFLVQLIWDLVGNVVVLMVPENLVTLIVFVADLSILSLYLIGSLSLRNDSRHFRAGYTISIILIAAACLTTILRLSPVEVDYDISIIVPLVLSFILTYQLIKGIIDRQTGSPVVKLARRLMTYWKTSLWLLGGLIVTLVVGMVTILGTLTYQADGQMIEPEWLVDLGEDFIVLMVNEVLPIAGPFLILVMIALVGLILAYLIIRILFVVTVYQLTANKAPAPAEDPLRAVE